ncbi:Glycosyl hydrolase, five-bladed beta-propellor domain containing protein [Amanita muscaria]
MTGILLQVVVALSVVATSAAQNSSSNVNDDPAQPLFPESFADPAFVKDPKTNYFWAFSTRQCASNWTASPPNVWAPDVVLIEILRSPFDNLTNKPGYVMYYSASSSQESNMHCVGTAYSRQPQGPYEASPKPLVCPLDQGGAIDPNGFRDPATGKQYVTYKVDANSIGSGGACGNSVVNPKQKATPIRIQEVDSTDGTTLIGNYVEIENAIFPKMSPTSRRPVSSLGCFSDPSYTVKYATNMNGILHGANNTNGPAVSHYDRGLAPLLTTGDYVLVAPGGFYAGPGGVNAIWHSTNTSLPGSPRQLHKARLNVTGTTVSFMENTTGLHGGSSNTSNSTSSPTSASLSGSATTTGSGEYINVI